MNSNGPNHNVNTIPATVPRRTASPANSSGGSASDSVPAPPQIRRIYGPPPEAHGEAPPTAPRAAPTAHPTPIIPDNLAQVLHSLTQRLQTHENRAVATENEIQMLREQNRILQDRLDEAHAGAQQDDTSSVSSDVSNAPNHAINNNGNGLNVANDLIQRLISAQEESNRLQVEARTADRRARIKDAPVKFPRLQCLSSKSVDTWYTRLMPVLIREKYNCFYDALADDLVPNGAFNPGLNSILFSEIITSLSNSIQDYIYS